MTVYCAIENTRFEHIRYMEDSLVDLAKKLGCSHSSLRSANCRGITCKGYKIETVKIDGSDDEQ